MKKAFCNKRNLIFVLFSLLAGCFLFLTSCGLDDWYVINPPERLSEPNYSGIDEQVFEFRTGDASEYDGSGFEFHGTQVYYRIFDNVSTLENVKKNIISSSLSPETMDGRAQSNGFRVLTEISDSSPVTVRIKLTGSLVTPPFIELNGSNKGIPYRRIGGTHSFNFSSSDYPKSGEDDYSGSSEEGPWYVMLCANAVGHDVSFANYYSDMVYLGAVRIDKK